MDGPKIGTAKVRSDHPILWDDVSWQAMVVAFASWIVGTVVASDEKRTRRYLTLF